MEKILQLIPWKSIAKYISTMAVGVLCTFGLIDTGAICEKHHTRPEPVKEKKVYSPETGGA